MTVQNKAQFVVDLTGNVAQRAKSFGSSISAMGRTGSRSMQMLSSAMSASNRMLDKFDNKLVGFATGGGLVMAAKKVGDWQQQLTELGTRYNLTAEQSDGLLNTVYATGAAYKMPYSDVITALDKMLERTNDVSGSISNVDNIAKAIKGLGLNADEAGAHVAQLMNKGVTSDNINKLFNGVASASKIGTGNIREQFAGIVELTKNTQWQSPEQLMQLLAIQRLSDAQLGNSADAASALKSFADTIKDKKAQQILKLNGIDVYSDANKLQFKDPAQLLLEIGNRSKFKEHNLKTIFPENLIKTTQAFANSEQQQKLLAGVKIEDGLLESKTSKNINTFNGALTSLTNAGERWAQLKLAKPIQDLADAINSLTPEQLDAYTSKLETGAKIIGGAIAARYVYRGYRGIKNMLGGHKLGGAIDSAVSSAGATPVFVTNWPSDFSGAGGNNRRGGVGFGRNNAKSLNVVAAAAELLINRPSIDELPETHQLRRLQEMREHPERFYDLGNEQTWRRHLFNPEIDNSLQNFDRKLTHALTSAIDAVVPTGASANRAVNGNIPILAGANNGRSEIVLKIEPANGLTVKTKSVDNIASTDIVVNTGKTYSMYGGGAY
ncbi:hypothetical protein ACGH6R_02495 [Gilliamella sp. CG13]|uniref:hypothetical protein n=1 Tax=Gilliamella sp. CG13 TaxID=3351502 RepID=UPI0039880A70